MSTHQPSETPHGSWLALGAIRHSTDSYGLVLLLILLDYLVVSTLMTSAWGKVVVVTLLGVTVLLTLRTSRARRLWQFLALIALVVNVALALLSVVSPTTQNFGNSFSIAGGLLLIVTPFVIGRRISAHRIVTTETVLGALCIYLFIGFSFAFIYLAISSVSHEPFFSGQQQVTVNDYLFFSYTTLTTVGYGDLVPAGALGQTFAMVEALTGQIYLVIVVARLVSLWGQVRTPAAPWKPETQSESSANRGVDQQPPEKARPPGAAD